MGENITVESGNLPEAQHFRGGGATERQHTQGIIKKGKDGNRQHQQTR